MKDKIISEIKKDLLNLLNYKTIKDNYSEINLALNYIEKELSKYFIKEIMVGDYKNLVVSNTLEKELDVIFGGHIDVVPSENYDCYEKDGKVFGRGSFDMKGQIAVMMSLFKYNTSNKKIALILTSDEEIGGYCCKEIVKDYDSKLAVIPDAGKNFDLIVEEKGLLQLELKVNGVSAHASEPYKGENPIVKLIDIYEKILIKYPLPKDVNDFKISVNLSKITGGDSINMVPSVASMFLDIRFIKEDTIENILDSIKQIEKDVEITILDKGPTFHVNPKLSVIKKFIDKASLTLKRDLKIAKCVATCDGIYFSEKNIPTILINPIGDFWHNPKEYVEIDSLYTLYEIFKGLL